MKDTLWLALIELAKNVINKIITTKRRKKNTKRVIKSTTGKNSTLPN